MKKSNQLRFIPNRTNLLSGNQYGNIMQAIKKVVVDGHHVEHVRNRKDKVYLKFQADHKASTKFHFRAYTYTLSGQQIEITRRFHNNCEMMLIDEALKVTRAYNEKFM